MLVGSGSGTVIRLSAMGGTMTAHRTFVIPAKVTAYGAVLFALALIARARTISGQEVKRSSGRDEPRIPLRVARCEAAPAHPGLKVSIAAIAEARHACSAGAQPSGGLRMTSVFRILKS